jgi:hypothetical protein
MPYKKIIEIKNALSSIANAKKTLRDHKVIRSERLTGEIGEYLASIQLDGVVEHAESTTNKGWDLLWYQGDSKKEGRVQVKCHAKGPKNIGKYTIVRHVDDFEWLMIVVLSHDYHLTKLYLIPKDEVVNIGDYKQERKEYVVVWDKFSDFLVNEHDLNSQVKKIFQKHGTNELELDDEYTETKWEIFTAPNSKTVYFAPISWLPWNITDNKNTRLKNRHLVFELYKRRNDWKISLLGAIGQNNIPGTKPNTVGEGKTVCYRLWGGDKNALPEILINQDDDRPDFPTDSVLEDWLNRWVEKHNQLQDIDFWKWIEQINEWGSSKERA